MCLIYVIKPLLLTDLPWAQVKFGCRFSFWPYGNWADNALWVSMCGIIRFPGMALMAAFQAFKGMRFAAEQLFHRRVRPLLAVLLLSGGLLFRPTRAEPWPAVTLRRSWDGWING